MFNKTPMYSDTINPHRYLALCVVQQAIADGKSERRDGPDAIEWLRGNEDSELMLAVADIDPDKFNETIEKLFPVAYAEKV